MSIRTPRRRRRTLKDCGRSGPGCFLGSPRGDSEARLIWDKRDVVLGGNRVFGRADVRGKLTVYDKEEQKDIRRKRLAKGEEKTGGGPGASCLGGSALARPPPRRRRARSYGLTRCYRDYKTQSRANSPRPHAPPAFYERRRGLRELDLQSHLVAAFVDGLASLKKTKAVSETSRAFARSCAGPPSARSPGARTATPWPRRRLVVFPAHFHLRRTNIT